jgi:signal transduction histidine kinase
MSRALAEPAELAEPAALAGPPASAEPSALAALRRARAERAAVLRRRARPIVLAVVVILGVAVARSSPRPGLHGHSLGILLAGGCLLAVTLVALRLSGPMWGLPRPGLPPAVYVPLFAVLVSSSVALSLLQPQGPGAVGLYMAVALAARAFSGLVSSVLMAGCLVFLVAMDLAGQGYWHSGHEFAPGIISAIALVAVYSMSRFGRRIREQEAAEDRLVAELAASRGAELKAAALAERQRLAREMHDVLAHSLSGLVVQLEGTRLLAATAPDDPRLPAAIDRAHQLAKGGLDEARQAIGMLRGDDLPGPERIAALAAEFAADTGVPCRFETGGPARELDPAVRLALYRITQEALTNVRKHARPDTVAVRLDYLPETVRLTIEDSAAAPVPRPLAGDGSPAGGGVQVGDGAVQAGGGYGLAGMRERAGLLGGRLITMSIPNGFRVTAEVPA